MIELIIYSKPGCHLCDIMKDTINKVKDDIDFNFTEINIDEDPSLFEKYKEKIPVLEINGKIFAKFRVDEDDLKVKLSAIWHNSL